jgi:hypothetical protein
MGITIHFAAGLPAYEQWIYMLCPGPDSNRHGLRPRDFKSLASTCFATRALQRRIPASTQSDINPRI